MRGAVGGVVVALDDAALGVSRGLRATAIERAEAAMAAARTVGHAPGRAGVAELLVLAADAGVRDDRARAHGARRRTRLVGVRVRVGSCAVAERRLTPQPGDEIAE